MNLQNYEALVRRLKVLSKSQTALLKAFLHGKLTVGVSLVNKAVEYLNKVGEDAKATELRNALLSLKLNDIEVDVGSTQVMLHEELSILRGAIEGGILDVPKPPPAASSIASTGSSAADLERLKVMENENTKLRELLKEAQHELSTKPAALPPAPPIAASVVSSNTEELKALRRDLEEKSRQCDALKKEVDTLTEQLQRSAASLAASQEGGNQAERSLRAELEAAKREIASAQSQLSQCNVTLAAATKDAAAMLASRTKELTDAAAAQVKELEAEKDEMMEAMAQEVDEIEKTKAAEKELLVADRDKWHNKFTALQRVNHAITFGFKRLTDDAKALTRDYAAHVAASKRELADVSAHMKAIYTGTLLKKLKDVNEGMKATNLKYRREMGERKRLHNLVQELKGNIRVYMRCRPPTTKEIEQFGNDAQCVSFTGPGEVRVFNEKNREKTWEFDEVFDTASKQSEVYEDVSALVTSVMDGFNVCIFAYGQTGSGKTWTMSGPPDNRGVNTRALEELFQKARERSGEWRDTITVSVLEVYNEDIRDLLADSRNSEEQKLEVKMGEYGNHVPGLTSVPVDNIATVFNLLNVADRNRASTTTNMNEHSSRSHMMLTVTVVSEFLPTGVTSRGKLNLVDLAGSERINKSGAVGQALKEAQNINKSLSALGDVIAARAQKTAHVPFRNSTLTFLLQDSLSQDSKTLMIVCVSPVLYNAEETFCSLNFAARVRTVELGKASKNTIASGSSAASGSAKSNPPGTLSAGVSSKSNSRQSISGAPGPR